LKPGDHEIVIGLWRLSRSGVGAFLILNDRLKLLYEWRRPMPPAAPEGFQPHDRKSPMTNPWEPLFARKTDDRVVLGLTVAAPHTNSRGLLHGGLIAALADNAMGLSCAIVLARDGVKANGLITVSLAVDYMGKAEIGDWLEFDTEFVRAGRTLCFAGAVVIAGGQPIARAHATFRVHTSSSS
jgi:uncharacterized protein (TIGR00369 family)